METRIIQSSYLDIYKKKQPISISKHFNKVKSIEMDSHAFGYNISNSAVHSSMIEGNPIDFDSYLNFSASGMNTKSKSYLEIEDLINAYRYACKNKLSYQGVLYAHGLLSKTIIEETKYNGNLRDKDVYVFSQGIKKFTGASIDVLKNEMDIFFEDISILLSSEMSITEVFYFASMIHLVFVQIHPFADGNGRTARLLEKWFLAEKIGEKACFIQSEKLYQSRLNAYYKNVDLGTTYQTINYDLSLPFLLMLPMALRLK